MEIYRDGDTYIAPRGSYFEGNVKINGNFIVPAYTHFWGHLAVDGNIDLGPRSTIRNRLTCRNAVIGASARIGGAVNVEGDITVCDNASLLSVTAGGDVVLRPGVHVGDVKSGATIYVYGKAATGKLLGKQVKILRDPYSMAFPPSDDIPEKETAGQEEIQPADDSAVSETSKE